MRIAEINMCANGSTGKIMLQIAQQGRLRGHEVWTYSTNAFSYKYKKLPVASDGHRYFGSYFENAVHYFFGRVFGYNGCFSRFATHRLIRELKKNKVEVVHLHNLHSFCFKFPLFFGYVKKNNIRLIWTLHDCWAFTGHCPHFDMIGCDKWKNGCYSCPLHKNYPASELDDSKQMYRLKKKWFTGVKDMTLVSPSRWLADLVKQSFLKNYPVEVINNGIDLNVFKPTDSDFRARYGCEDKHIVLGVAFGWGERKGLDVFVELAKLLDSSYQIVLVGTNEAVDKQLPDNIISIHRTHDQAELAAIYTAADVFVNPTREDNFPTVNMEALACGTPVITFETGGSPEVIDDCCGSVVNKNDIQAMLQEIVRVCSDQPYSKQECLNKAQSFDAKDRYNEYINLFEEKC